MIGTPSWGAWQRLAAEIDPYVHWWQAADGSGEYARENFPVSHVDTPHFHRGRATSGTSAPSYTHAAFTDGSEIPVPRDSRNPGWPDVTDWLPQECLDAFAADQALYDLAEETVLLGVIDTGIPLHHRRFRLPSGESRFLAAWQQSAQWDTLSQGYLPFGRELYRTDIEDHLLTASRSKDLQGSVDEAAFNRAAGLVEPLRPRGQGNRDLDHPNAHGAHVLDLAGGFDPTTQTDEAARCRILAVNLPPPFSHGPHGNFLQFFALLAVERIVALAEAAWIARFGDAPGRFPLVINFSYGMHAGPKDGALPFEAAIRDLMQGYSDRGGALRLCMPSGNNNLERNTARITPPANGLVTLNWRITPEDHTSNLVELWSQPKASPPMGGAMSLSLTEPGTKRKELPAFPSDKDGHLVSGYCDLTNTKGDVIARAYVRPRIDGRGEHRVQFILCVAPSAMKEPLSGVGTAPAGAWEIGIAWPGNRDTWIDAHVQVDQSAELFSDTGRRAYFEDAAYRGRDNMGKLIDSYPYPYRPLPPPASPIRRRGTHNPLATSPGIVMVAGYEAKSGAPANYSGASWDEAVAAGHTPDITVALPSEDAKSVFGLLAAGSSDGALTAYRGTSMATGLASRRIVEEMLRGTSGDSDPSNVGTPTWLGSEANTFETFLRPAGYSDAAEVKVGQGRLPYPKTYRSGAVPRVPQWD
ncbi:MAG: hypothetical protein MK098_07945 [Marinovum sp.]|nr:hypothetical protein [Marinovum sp.]